MDEPNRRPNEMDDEIGRAPDDEAVAGRADEDDAEDIDDVDEADDDDVEDLEA